ncbi:serine/threonine protein kinase [Paenibacillus xerothermodurans]|uniref:Serine/threonine protein kinase n=1 Tax=Paenibacillus xerothermodurans TaxID=1977292 RepID=A0A2W1N6U6_PAEXE|nr:serine/threonine protein kinase [Paenibacillus xerothermodurans]PZE20147.1 serine/threonine protein kinase [Paenibacillus xerothermodurans]
MLQTQQLITLVEQDLLPQLDVESVNPHDPIEVRQLPAPWQLVGAGNYAVVVAHPAYSDLVVKVYAPGRPGLEEEAEVYRRLGSHPAYSECFHAGDNYLILKRLNGVTLYNCMLRGIPIPKRVIQDIDEALDYARSKGLNPHDVHGKNVMLQDGRGKVVDVSDFLKEEPCFMWRDLKRAYNFFYFPAFSRLHVPAWVMTAVRKGYRFYRKRLQRTC